jgi:hypothetical protein
MKVIQFYRGEIPNDSGTFIDEVLGYNHEQLEADHAYIQWLLPTKEPSMFNPDAPLITDDEIVLFANDPELQEKASQALVKMVDFFGMTLFQDQVIWQEPDEEHGHKDPKWWTRYFNHNFLRMTRLLWAMRYLGRPNWSEATYSNLLNSHFYHDSFEYWREAARAPLP